MPSKSKYLYNISLEPFLLIAKYIRNLPRKDTPDYSYILNLLTSNPANKQHQSIKIDSRRKGSPLRRSNKTDGDGAFSCLDKKQKQNCITPNKVIEKK